MARERIIEGMWTCSSCGQEGIPGREKVCPSCGNPREDEEANFDFGKRAASGAVETATVVEGEALQLAAAGTDWYCANCGTANRGDAQACRNCGNEDPAVRLAKQPKLPTQSPPPKPKPSFWGKSSLWGIGCTALLLGGIAIAICGGWWLLSTETVDGKVESLSWERTIHIETFTPTTTSGWQSSMPSGRSRLPTGGRGESAGADNVRACSKKQKTPAGCDKKTRRVACGSEEKCEVKDLGNGFAKETCEDIPKYCDETYEECHEAVYENWCTWDSYAWKRKDTVRKSENNGQPQWPSTSSLGTLDREVREASYRIGLQYSDDGKWVSSSFSPENEQDFKQFSIGQSITVDVGIRGITNVQPLKSR